MASRTGVKRVGRIVAWPMLRLLEPRFADLVARVADLRAAVRDIWEVTEHTRQVAEDTRQVAEDTRRRADMLAAGVEEGRQVIHATQLLVDDVQRTVRGTAELLERARAELLEGYAPAAEEALTFAGTQLREVADEVRALSDAAADRAKADVRVGGVDIVQAFALRALGRVDPPARVLDVGGAAQPLAMLLATLGYHVRAIDPRPYVHAHPAIEFSATSVRELPLADARFDAAVLHEDVDGHGLPTAETLRHVGALLRDGGLLVLAFAERHDGVPGAGAAGLDVLADGWSALEQVQVAEHFAGCWVRTEPTAGAAAEAG